MNEWEMKKLHETNIKQYQKAQKEEREVMSKQLRQQNAHKEFKEWLKKSLINQREEILTKRMKD